MDKPQRSPILLLAIGGVLLIAAAALILIPGQSSETPAVAEEVAPLVEAGLPFPEVARISVADTKTSYDNNSAIIVDVRSADAYASSHIANALSIPEEEIEARSQELPLDKEVLLYCT